jgi:hypothetical protein
MSIIDKIIKERNLIEKEENKTYDIIEERICRVIDYDIWNNTNNG